MRTRLCLVLVAVVVMAMVLVPQTEGKRKSWLSKWLRNRASAKKKIIKINTGGSKLKPSTVSKKAPPTQNNIKRRSAETMELVPPPPPSVLAPEFLQQWYTMCLNRDNHHQTAGALLPQRAGPSMKALLRALQLSAGSNNADMLCSLLAAEESAGSNDQYAPGNVVA